MSVAMWNCHSWPLDISTRGIPLSKCVPLASFGGTVFKASIHDSVRGSIGQHRFICQVLCTGIQGSSALVLGGPLAKEGSSAKLGVLVFKASLLWYLGAPSTKVGLSSKFCVLVFKASLLYYWGVHWLKRVYLQDSSSRTFRCGHPEVFSYYIRKTNDPNNNIDKSIVYRVNHLCNVCLWLALNGCIICSWHSKQIMTSKQKLHVTIDGMSWLTKK